MRRFCIFYVYMQKSKRHELIQVLVRSAKFRRQSELVSILAKKGFTVTQASVSRDLEELGIVKINGIYSLPHVDLQSPQFGLFSLQPAGPYLLVAKCSPGLASAAAVRIDAAGIPEVVGTVAGDDTVFIAVTNESDQKAAIPKILKLFETN